MASWDFQPEFAFQEADLGAVSLLDMFLSSPPHCLPNCTTLVPPAAAAGIVPQSESEQQQQQSQKKQSAGSSSSSSSRRRSIKNGGLSRERISEYFYLPIAEAARELKVGVTLLKKRCRELGIRRWPRRKLQSLKTLINNVQEMGNDEGEEKMREAVEILEREKKIMEEMNPDMELKERTKRLRQACFKAQYKKKKVVVQSSAILDQKSCVCLLPGRS